MSIDPAIDRDAFWKQVGEDAELLVEVIDMFLDELPLSRDSLRVAVVRGDAHAIDRAAHRIKGALMNLAAKPAADAAFALENLGRSGSLDGLAERSEVLDRELDRAAAALVAIRAETRSGV